jgi:hypothetical protein
MLDKTESHASENSEQQLPFFARFLEGQDNSKEAYQTLKYPSDRDEIDWKPSYISND